MQPFNLLREQLGKSVPFASYVGVEIVEVGQGTAITRIGDAAETKNHIGSQHAGALFTLAETASGAAMAGAFLAAPMQIRPVVAQSTIRFLKIARGAISASARVEREAIELVKEVELHGRVRFPVEVSLSDEGGEEVAAMNFDWHVSTER